MKSRIEYTRLILLLTALRPVTLNQYRYRTQTIGNKCLGVVRTAFTYRRDAANSGLIMSFRSSDMSRKGCSCVPGSPMAVRTANTCFILST